MSRQAGRRWASGGQLGGWVVGHGASSHVNFFSKLYVTFILQRIAFIFGRDEEEDQ